MTGNVHPDIINRLRAEADNGSANITHSHHIKGREMIPSQTTPEDIEPERVIDLIRQKGRRALTALNLIE